MANIHPLYSSSSGNMFHLETDKTDILIDVGVSYKAINEGLHSINKDISNISAILITHEHVDHIKGLALLCRKNPNIPIYACNKTAKYLEDYLKEKNIPSNIIKINYGQPFKIVDMDITPFEISHDALSPCGFYIENNNVKLSYATDLGYVSNEVFEYLNYADHIVLESNYDKTMLEFGKYPYNLKYRIKSNTGHLSNIDASNTVLKLIENGKSDFIFAHLSENNNNSNVLMDTLTQVLKTNGINDFSNINLNIASKNLSNEEYNLC